MAQDIVSGLFGLTPSQVAQQQRQQLAAQAQQYAQQDPFQRATAGMYQAGAGLAQAGAEGLFGMQNPEVTAAQQRQAMAQQMDLTTPQGTYAAAKLAQDRGDVEMASKLAAMARQMEEEQSVQQFRAAQTQQMLAPKTEKVDMTNIEKLYAARDRALAAGNKQMANSIEAVIRKETKVSGGGASSTSSVTSAAKQERTKPLSATEQKELFEADEMVQASQNVQSALQSALELNDKAYSGFGAKARAIARSNLPGESDAANATIELDNLMTGQALESLKSTFGSMPTEGERKILLEMQASAEKTPEQRKAIIKRAIEMAKRRENLNADKAEKLRTGEYSRPGGAPSVNKGAVSLDQYLKSQGY